jgi:hypothetical protein
MKRVFAGLVIVVAMVFLFQNCGKAGFEQQDFANELNVASEVDPKLSALSFPYEVSVNQIAHMSCPLNFNNASVQTPYFSWKVGAFDNTPDVPSSLLSIRPAGLQLSSKFQQEWSKVSAIFDPSIKNGKLREALTTLPSVANTQLQISFRKSNSAKVDLMSMPTGGDSPTKSFMPPLSSTEVSDSFLDLPIGPINLFAGVTDFSSRFLESSLIVPSAYGFNDTSLRANYDSSYLTIGFLKTAGQTSPNELSGPGTEKSVAYGKGYRVHFGAENPHQGTTAYPSSDSLSVIEEHDLETGQITPGVNWNRCYKLKIVRPQDRYKPMYRANHFVTNGAQCPTANVNSVYCASPVNNRFGIDLAVFQAKGYAGCPSNRPLLQGDHCEEQYFATCPPEPYAGNTGSPHPILTDEGLYHPNHPERPAILHVLRRFLPANQWDINVSRGCVVPKQDDNACYSATPPEKPIVYDETFFQGAAANLDFGQYTGCGVNSLYQCAAYVTVCVRQ